LIAVSGAIADVAMNTLLLHDQLPQSRIKPLNRLLDERVEAIAVTRGHPGQTLAQAIAHSLSKCEAERFGAVVEELDLKPPVTDWSGLADKLIHPLPRKRAIPVEVDVNPVGRPRALTVEQHAKP
jgi:hypothetical protein